MHSLLIIPAVVITLLLAAPKGTIAYIGPGAGIAAIGTVIALIGGILLAIVAFLWYPIKRLLAKVKQKRMNDQEDTPS
jgi:membrane protein implicated in regulation of membrane protease activity